MTAKPTASDLAGMSLVRLADEYCDLNLAIAVKSGIGQISADDGKEYVEELRRRDERERRLVEALEACQEEISDHMIRTSPGWARAWEMTRTALAAYKEPTDG